MTSEMVVVVTHLTEIQQDFANVLSRCGLEPVLASTVQEAMTILNNHPVSLVFCFDELPDNGLDIVIRQTFLKDQRRVPVVVVSRFDDWERYLEFLHYGAFDYVLYPLSSVEVERILSNIRNLHAFSNLQVPVSAQRLRVFSELHKC